MYELEDKDFKCADCSNYGLCSYYHNRKETSAICSHFRIKDVLLKQLSEARIEEIKEARSLRDSVNKLMIAVNDVKEMIDRIEEAAAAREWKE